MKTMDSAREAFNAQSSVFDETYQKSLITNYARSRIRSAIKEVLTQPSRILEINGGTGEDAIYFAKQGHQVLSTDISEDMIAIQRSKIDAEGLNSKINSEILSYENLDELKGQKFDFIYSNFGGLNCTNQLDKVIQKMPDLLNANGKICLVVMPPVCLWEFVFLLNGKFRQAFRRLNKNGTPSHIEGKHFLSWYYNPGYIQRILKTQFKTLNLESLCLVVPPVFYERHIIHRPKLFKLMNGIEQALKRVPILRNMGDYYILIMEKKD